MADGGNIVRRVDVFRSSISEPFLPRMTHANDMRRPITSEGVKLARLRQGALGYPRYDLGLFSPAMRCMYTAAEIGDIAELPVFLQVEELGYKDKSTTEGAVLAELFSRLGDANLRAYNHADTKNVIEDHAHAAWDKVWEIIVECGSKRTLVIGHNVLINAMGFIATFDRGDLFSQVTKEFETRIFGKCDGYSLILKDKEVTAVEIYAADL